MLPQLMPNAFAWPAIDKSWLRSIIVLRVSKPRLGLSALAKKSFSSASYPILA
jgi:hypothetical protein